MAHFRTSMITIYAVILAVMFQQAMALKCWSCSEDEEKCMDPFDIETLQNGSEQAYKVECNKKIWNAGSPVCLKAKSSTTGKVRRECSNSKEEATIGWKLVGGMVGFDQCEICETDLCNAAIHYGPATLLTFIPLVIMKILSI